MGWYNKSLLLLQADYAVGKISCFKICLEEGQLCSLI